MLDVLIQPDLLGELVEAAVNPHTHISRLSRLRKQFLMHALAAAHNRGKQLQAGAFRQCHQRIHHLVHGLLFDLSSAGRAVHDTTAGIQKTKVVIDLRDGADCRSGVAVGRFLVDGDRGRKSLQAVHLRFLHLPQKLAGITGEGFHVTSLPFRVDRIKSKTALA